FDLGRQEFQGAYWINNEYVDRNHFAYLYKQWADSGMLGQRDDFVLAPIAILDESMPFTRFESANYQWGGDQTQYYRFRSVYRHQDNSFFNHFNSWKLNNIIVRESNNNYEVAVSHANVFPLFRVGHILKTVF